VYPRTATLEQVQTEYQNQLSGITADEHVVDIGKGDNPGLVLSVAARRLGKQDMFNASIINLESGVQVAGRSENYNTLDDGIRTMENIARALTGVSMAPGDVLFGDEDLNDSRKRAREIPRARPSGETPHAQPSGETTAPKRSGGSAFGYGALNLAGGLGSFIQGDWGGGLVCLAGYGAAAGLIVWELSMAYEDKLAGIPGSVGLGVAGVTVLYGFIRPAVYKRSHRLAGIADRITLRPRRGIRARMRYGCPTPCGFRGSVENEQNTMRIGVLGGGSLRGTAAVRGVQGYVPPRGAREGGIYCNLRCQRRKRDAARCPEGKRRWKRHNSRK
jgi:hypothetical protein